jgi:trans-2-enoyl-CoA reductase
MKQVQIGKFGEPTEAVSIVDVPDLSITASDDVLVRVLLAPVGPADIATFWGRYPRPYKDSLVPGIEGIGVVEALGADVRDLRVGERVLSVRFDCWSEQLLLKRNQVAKVSSDVDILQQCNLKVNGCTAEHLLSQVVDLKSGDWIVQDAANSTVGQYIVQIARARGIRTINIVRSEEAATRVRNLGGDVVVTESPDLAAVVRDAVKNASIKLAIDCVGGPLSDVLADLLAENGTLVVYGALAQKAVEVSPIRFITKNIQVRGFWITRWLKSAPIDEIQRLVTRLDQVVLAGGLKTEVTGVYPLSDIKSALNAAGAGGRNGKVVLNFGNT